MDRTCWNLPRGDRRWGVFYLRENGWVETGSIWTDGDHRVEETGLVLPADFTWENERTRWHLEHMLRPMRKKFWDKKNRRPETEEDVRKREEFWAKLREDSPNEQQ